MELKEQNEFWKGKWSAFWSGWIMFFLGFFWIVLAQIVAVIILAVISTLQIESKLSEDQIMAFFMDGDAIGIAFLIALPLMIVTLLVIIKYRRKKLFLDYIGLRMVKAGEVIRWLVYLLVFAIVTVIGESILDRPPTPEWMLTAYDSTDYVWLLFVAVGILGPITEEVLYRGYILKVWSQSKLGVVGSIVMVSVIWAGSHLQYDLYDMSWIALFGVMLSISRLKTNSIIPAIIMHMSWNIFSLILMVMTYPA